MGWYCPQCGHEADREGRCPADGEVLARVSSHDLLGRRLGEYMVLAVVGGGAYGTVYRAIHPRSGLVVAIKLLHHSIDVAEGTRVVTEARAAAMLRHPNVVQVHDLGLTSDRRPYIVMQYLDGKPLSEVLFEGKVPLDRARSITADLLAGLGAAHARGIVHRDLKPDNVFLAGGRAVIVDFGLAKLVADPNSPNLTITGESIGTPQYMAPEQVRGKAVDARADLYAAACVIFELLAGRPPFDHAATFALFDAHLHEPPPSVRAFRPDAPPAVDAALARALAKDPAARFASAREMLRALSSRTRRKRWPYYVAAGALGVATVTTIAFTRSPATELAMPGSAAPNARTSPPAVPTEIDEPIEPALLETLRAIQAQLEAGRFTREHAATMLCSLHRQKQDLERTMVETTGGAGLPRQVRGYFRRYRALLVHYFPDLDETADCANPK